ncbi:DNA polymerase III subunit epsilon [Candidatus Providencia siddallii]|uniref:DNA polymerase III subunit epsilon n=1 Tax=Candidatus Providencia siddallii TaxID=1715285 RepID=A0ABM9NNH6_9GAMM
MSIIRQVVLDTETTGINKFGIHYEGHNIIEIGAIEIINRRLTNNNFHVYIKPNRLVDPEAFKIHGISDDFLQTKPSFEEIVNDFIDFIYDAELIIHNAFFDIGFINYEFFKLKKNIPNISNFCTIIDTLSIARKMFPGKRNNLNALCDRYMIDNSKRVLHGALLDAEILSDVYLAMTGGQTSFSFESNKKTFSTKNEQKTQILKNNKNNFKILYASPDELIEHEKILDIIDKKSNKCCFWRKNDK